MRETVRTRLGDVIRVKHGFAFPGSGFSESSSHPTLLTPGNFEIGGGFKYTKPKSFTGEFPGEYLLTPRAVVITMTDLSKNADTLGLPAMIPEKGDFLHNQRIGLIEVMDKERVSESFLNYYLRTDDYRQYVIGTASGSTVRHTSPSRIEDYVAELPSLPEQRAIAEVLGSLDDKIAANISVSRVADELANSSFLLTSRGQISTATLMSVGTVVLGGTPRRDIEQYWTNGTVPWLTSSKANEGVVIEPSRFITEEALSNSAAKLMPRGATIIAITGATLGQISRLGIDAAGNQSLVGVWHNERQINDWLYFTLRNRKNELLRHATGAAQQHINKSVVENFMVALPESTVLSSFYMAVCPLIDILEARARESITLAHTRDELIPLLMTGRIQVRDAIDLIEEVAP